LARFNIRLFYDGSNFSFVAYDGGVSICPISLTPDDAMAVHRAFDPVLSSFRSVGLDTTFSKEASPRDVKDRAG